MKPLRRIIDLLILLFPFAAFSQSSVFIIVDVSGSGPNINVKLEGKEIAKELCLGRFDQSRHPLWRWQQPLASPIQDIVNSRTTPLLDPAQDCFLGIMPAGFKNTYTRYKIQKIQNIQQDFVGFFEQRYPTSFSERLTFIDIARAVTASLAKGRGLSNYYLIEISDMGYDTGSQDPLYTKDEKELLAHYGSVSSSTTKLGTLYYEGPDSKNYQILVSRVNIQQLNIPASKPAPTNVERKTIDIVRPKSISKNKPDDNKTTNLSVLWNCLGCLDSTLFSVRATYVGGGKRVAPVSVKSASSQARLSFKEPGVYKITVSGDGVTAKPTYVKIGKESTGGGGGLLLLFLLAAIGGLVYYFFSRSNQVDRTPKEKPNQNQRFPRKSKNSENENYTDNSGELF
jgi:hypothetical protein